jgi:hypothetical protein
MKLVRDEVEGVARKLLDDAARPTLLRVGELFAATRSLRGTVRKLNAEMGTRPDLLPCSKKNKQWDAHKVKRVLLDEDLRRLGCWPADLLPKIDAALADCEHQAPKGAAAPVHLRHRSWRAACAVAR